MNDDAINEFAEILIREVRDAAIRDGDINADPTCSSSLALRWQAAGVPPSAAKMLIPDCIDLALFYLLNAIDSGSMQVTFKTRDNQEINLSDAGEGELAGWYLGTDSWRERYSKERCTDFSDDNLKPG